MGQKTTRTRTRTLMTLNLAHNPRSTNVRPFDRPREREREREKNKKKNKGKKSQETFLRFFLGLNNDFRCFKPKASERKI